MSKKLTCPNHGIPMQPTGSLDYRLYYTCPEKDCTITQSIPITPPDQNHGQETENPRNPESNGTPEDGR